MKKILTGMILVMVTVLSGCFMSTEEMEKRKEEKKQHIMDVMFDRLEKKYDGKADANDIRVYGLSKGGNQAWFNYGFYPATGEYEGEEFEVRIKTNGKKFDVMEDNLYALLYGDEVRAELESLVSDLPVTDVKVHYEMCEELPMNEDELKSHLVVTADYELYDPEEPDEICDIIDMLNSEGYIQNIHIKVETEDNHMQFSTQNMTSDDLRAKIK